MIKNTVLEAKDIWKGYLREGNSVNWILQGINLEIVEGDFIAVLGAPGSGKSTLLKVLGFRETPEKGSVYFQGRLVGRRGEAELEQMRSERIWLMNGSVKGNKINFDSGKGFAAVLIDDPDSTIPGDLDKDTLQEILDLTRSGVAVVMATREPAIAARADSIYKLSGGKLDKLSGQQGS